ncbi:Zinc-binding GTPase YeiR [Zhongshania aliphaticivorans]|uniref:Zinc-binding GTPase YeiR n=1 Tax=Zhongshania aliphaticivorans TaxID=1470434 RepID=A0A5S9NJL7_9GAMM|nr:GTP-binding protein [Zhongshania aliphaticivorans]CAA0090012.1 Zinc-binding GTPase YeiR [Zhongshania aliphaticivorans]CAA0097233.1 Zinc-binding GTPase YeiR [Zhongshania aliphaticivorans]
MSKLIAIPTNVITGFLGVGKTTAILHLLKQKPDNERWAVLVNEFGEVGIDGSVFSGQETEGQGVFIREVPGGCMCCAAGLPMQIALNMLLSRAKPHRLLIEPTGLGHPKEVLAVLAAEHYKEVLDLRATITLVDARKVHDPRYTEHSTFKQQLAIADIIVANKAEQYQVEDFPALLDYLDKIMNLDNKSVYQVSQGQMDIDWLLTSAEQHTHPRHHHEHDTGASVLETPQMTEEGYLSIDNTGEGFYSRGWIFNPQWVFSAASLYKLFLGIDAERIKGVFITDQGIVTYNKADGVLSEAELDDSLDSRIECISIEKSALDQLEKDLFDCVVSP